MSQCLLTIQACRRHIIGTQRKRSVLLPPACRSLRLLPDGNVLHLDHTAVAGFGRRWRPVGDPGRGQHCMPRVVPVGTLEGGAASYGKRAKIALFAKTRVLWNGFIKTKYPTPRLRLTEQCASTLCTEHGTGHTTAGPRQRQRT